MKTHQPYQSLPVAEMLSAVQDWQEREATLRDRSFTGSRHVPEMREWQAWVGGVIVGWAPTRERAMALVRDQVAMNKAH